LDQTLLYEKDGLKYAKTLTPDEVLEIFGREEEEIASEQNYPAQQMAVQQVDKVGPSEMSKSILV